jgi:hypothetical protein
MAILRRGAVESSDVRPAGAFYRAVSANQLGPRRTSGCDPSRHGTAGGCRVQRRRRTMLSQVNRFTSGAPPSGLAVTLAGLTMHLARNHTMPMSARRDWRRRIRQGRVIRAPTAARAVGRDPVDASVEPRRRWRRSGRTQGEARRWGGRVFIVHDGINPWATTRGALVVSDMSAIPTDRGRRRPQLH